MKRKRERQRGEGQQSELSNTGMKLKEQMREEVLEALESNNVEGFDVDEEETRKQNSTKMNQSHLSSDEDSEEDEIDVDSDQELQVALESGLLKPGLNVELPAPEQIIYDKERLEKFGELLKEQNLDWLERMDVSCEPMDTSKCIPNQQILDTIQSNDLVNDDFKRELLFFRQAQAAISIAMPKLTELGVATERPFDYFAEMAKSDDHMKKVRERLLAKTKTAERVDKIRKLREAKKFGKKVQIEKELSKKAEKRKNIENVELYKKSQSKDVSLLVDDSKGNVAPDVTDKVISAKDLKKSSRPVANNKVTAVRKVNKLRQMRDKKYGYGGKKKRKNRNDKQSASAFDMGGQEGGRDIKRKSSNFHTKPKKSFKAKKGGGSKQGGSKSKTKHK